MSKTLVWQPDEIDKKKQAKPDENRKKNTNSKKNKSKPMSDVFWDSHIQSGEPVIFHFLDGSSSTVKILDRDIYHLKVLFNDDSRVVFKHALKWVEETSIK